MELLLQNVVFKGSGLSINSGTVGGKAKQRPRDSHKMVRWSCTGWDGGSGPFLDCYCGQESGHNLARLTLDQDQVSS